MPGNPLPGFPNAEQETHGPAVFAAASSVRLRCCPDYATLFVIALFLVVMILVITAVFAVFTMVVSVAFVVTILVEAVAGMQSFA